MEEPQPTNNQKFQKVQVKLGLLAQSKLQNIAESSLKHVQERLNCVQKKLADEISTHQASNRELRLRLRTYQEQCWQNDQKFKSSLKERSSQIEELKREIANYMQKQSEQRYQKDIWGQTNCHQKIEKIEKEVTRMKIDRKQDLEHTNQVISRQVTCHEAAVQPTAHRVNCLFNEKIETVRAVGNKFRDQIDNETENRERADQKVMEYLKGTVSEIKGALVQERDDRGANKQRLRTMLQEAARNLAGNNRQ